MLLLILTCKWNRYMAAIKKLLDWRHIYHRAASRILTTIATATTAATTTSTLLFFQIRTSFGRRNSWLTIQLERQAVGVRHRVWRPQQDHLRLRVRQLRPPSEGNILGHRHRLHRLAGKGPLRDVRWDNTWPKVVGPIPLCSCMAEIEASY